MYIVITSVLLLQNYATNQPLLSGILGSCCWGKSEQNNAIHQSLYVLVTFMSPKTNLFAIRTQSYNWLLYSCFHKLLRAVLFFSLFMKHSFRLEGSVLILCWTGNKGTWLSKSVNSATDSWTLKQFLGTDCIYSYQSKNCKDLNSCLIRCFEITDEKHHEKNNSNLYQK